MFCLFRVFICTIDFGKPSILFEDVRFHRVSRNPRNSLMLFDEAKQQWLIGKRLCLKVIV